MIWALLLVVFLVEPAAASRDPRKCGRVILGRAERMEQRGGVFKIPPTCLERVEFPDSVQLKQGPDGPEIWRDGQQWIRFRPANQVHSLRPQPPKRLPNETLTDKLEEAGMDVYDIPQTR